MNAVLTGAVVLALAGALCFAVGAVLQHRSVGDVTDGVGDDAALSWSRLRRLATRRGWLVGLCVAAAGTVLHAAALALAPLSVVQPVGVLAVPLAVLLTARQTRRWPTGAALAGVGMAVAGVAAFVPFAARTSDMTPVPAGTALASGAAALAVIAVLTAVGLNGRGWVRCMACAAAGAVAFGVVSTLVRVLSLQLRAGSTVSDPAVLALAAGIVVSVLMGAWLVQQGYAAGAPEVVVACLTVVDPVVAVGLGMALLGEGATTSPSTWPIMAAAAALAAAGAVVLARHHPGAVDGSPTQSATAGPTLRTAESARSRSPIAWTLEEGRL